jgi:molecular chaperone DnaK
VPQIEVMFDIDVLGTLSVSIQDQATGRSQSAVVYEVEVGDEVPESAIVQAGTVTEEARGLRLLNVTEHAIGIEGTNGAFLPIIARDVRLPAHASLIVSTTADYQTRLEVHILRGESDMAAYSKSLVRVELTSIPPAPRGVAPIAVMFDINIDGIVSFAVQAPTIGSARPTVIHPSDVLSQAEVSRLVNETRAREAEEKSKKGLDAMVRQLDGLVANTMRSVEALESELTGEEQNRILQAIEKAKKARADAALDDLRGHLADMEKAAAIIGQAMLRP